jgi:tRNA(fMet)-specific endonuclease VapC
MTARYLIDTDWTIDYLSGRQPIIERLQALQPAGLALSIISLAELYEGVLYSTDPVGNERALQNFLAVVEVLGIEQDTARRFGQERGRLGAAGMLIADADLLIGTTALSHGLILLTNNRRHFERLEGLLIESLVV